MKTRKLGINALLNISKSIMGMVFPLITYPYISRVLQAENIGKVNYSTSIVSYFLLIAMLGINVYATREGAQIRDDREKLEKFVSEVFSLNIITGLFSIGLLCLTVFLVPNLTPYKSLILIVGLQIPLSVLGADWINMIYEDYFYITIRTIVFQVVAVIAMFSFVRNQNDCLQYAACTIIAGYGAQLLNVFYTNRYCNKRFTLKINLKQHFIPIILLFATNLSSLIYSNADTTMLGWMTSDYNVGIYGTASKIYNIFKQLLFAIVVVCLPRFSNMLANSKREEYEAFAKKMYQAVFLLAIPLVVAIAILSPNIVDIIAGEGFVDAIPTLRIKCFAILFAILGYFNMQLVLLPAKKDGAILKATLAAGFFNIFANAGLIPLFQENGAAFTTAISELIVFLITKHLVKRITNLNVGCKEIIKTFSATFIMGLLLIFISLQIDNSILCILVAFVTGLITYFAVQLLFKNAVLIEFLEMFKMRFRRKVLYEQKP